MAQACKVAMIGAGYMAQQHLPAFADVPGVTLAGIYNRTRAKAEALAEEHHIAAVCDSVEELYQKTEADLAVVAIYETAGKDIILRALEFPWTLLVEKPVGLNLAETQAVYEAAQAKGRTVLVGLNRRFYSSTRAALSDLAQYASPRFIHVQDQQSLAQAASIGHDPAVVQSWMYANSIHLVDYLHVFGRGEIVSITPIVPWRGADSRVVLAKVEFDSGDIGLYEGIWQGPGPWAVSVTAAEKRWEMRPLEDATYQNAGERQRNAVDRSAADQTFKPGLRLQAEHAVRAALGQPHDSTTLAEAFKTTQLVRDIFGL